MNERSPRLPPLNTLRVFHVVMRHSSFRSAADELLVSPQAVSQQIKQLEDTIGVELFERKGRAIEPNERAILLNHYVQSGFAEFTEGIRRIIKSGGRERMNLNASPYFATRYLLEKLSHFREKMPFLDLRLTTMIDLPDFVGDEVDLSIQWGYGIWKNYEAKLLIQDLKIICCAPQLAAELVVPEDLLQQTLLHPIASDTLWSNVLAHMGVKTQNSARQLRLQDAATMRRATLTGLGVGLVSMIDAIEDLRNGKLVAPFGRDIMQTMPKDQVPGFYLVYPKGHLRVKSISAFCQWLQSQNWNAEHCEL